jgi:hypothetical protein
MFTVAKIKSNKCLLYAFFLFLETFSLSQKVYNVEDSYYTVGIDANAVKEKRGF